MKSSCSAWVGMWLLAGCTTVGTHDEAARALAIYTERPTITIRLCAYLDEGIDREEAEALLADAWDPDAEGVGIAWQLTRVGRYARPAYAYQALSADVETIPLPTDCDRLMVFLNRHFGDVMYGLFAVALPLPEVLGYADDLERPRGYVVARRATVIQIFVPPASTLRHELYHMLGCDHGGSLAPCYVRIERLRVLSRHLGYVPGWSPARGKFLLREGGNTQ